MRLYPFIALLVALTSVPTSANAESSDVPMHTRIDQRIEAGFAIRKATAADICSDADFVRRVYLDLSGVIPAADVSHHFIQSKDSAKRAKLIDKLLASKAYARHMARVFDVMLMERRPDKYVTTAEWRDYLATSFEENKPLSVLVSEILGADGVDQELRPAAKFYLDRAVEKDTLVRDMGRLFLGMNLQCAQCHDHPDINDYLHQHYHGLSVFVAGSKTFRQPDGTFVLQETVTREVEFASVFDPSETKKTGPRLIDALLELPELVEGEEYVEKPSRTVRAVPKFSLRELLSERLPSAQTPEFARNMANRLWAMMMGRGLVHPLDMHHSDNPPSHPQLLDALSAHLATTNYDVKAFLREVALSNTYQRSSLIPEGIDAADVKVDSFAVANMKGLSPEQMFESLMTATRASAVLEQQIDAALHEETDATDEAENSDAKKVAEARQKKRAERVAEFVSVFGSVPGQPEGEFTASLAQSLFLANSELISTWIPPQAGNLTERLMALVEPEPVAYELYLTVFSRLPTSQEIDVVSEQLDSVEPDDRRAAVAALVWSLLASVEFRLNH